MGGDVCGDSLAHVGVYELLLEINFGAFRSSPRGWSAGHGQSIVLDQIPPEQLNNSNLGSFAHAWIGVLEVRNKLRHVRLEWETLGLVHLWKCM